MVALTLSGAKQRHQCPLSCTPPSHTHIKMHLFSPFWCCNSAQMYGCPPIHPHHINAMPAHASMLPPPPLPPAALHPDDDSAANSAGADGEQQPRGPSAALRALQECTRATVAEQARLAPAVAPQQSSSAAPAATGGGGGSGSEQVNMIVDVVMQHLLSKDVLYAPMKEILQLYPPWLQRQQSGALPADELARYQQQYECVRRLVDAYEEEQQDPGRIMTLLQEVREGGGGTAASSAGACNRHAADLGL